MLNYEIIVNYNLGMVTNKTIKYNNTNIIITKNELSIEGNLYDAAIALRKNYLDNDCIFIKSGILVVYDSFLDWDKNYSIPKDFNKLNKIYKKIVNNKLDILI